jgi:hypothetical protein
VATLVTDTGRDRRRFGAARRTLAGAEVGLGAA